MPKSSYSCASCAKEVVAYPSQVGPVVYCSKSCYASSLRGKSPHNKGKRSIVTKPCERCGAEVSGAPSEVRDRRFCGKQCANDALKLSVEDQLANYKVSETGCWEYQGHLNGGYGRFKGLDGKLAYAHRVSYEVRVGRVPDGLFLDHLCRNRCCINPAHLEPVTNAENIRRGLAGKGGRSEAHRDAISAGLRRWNSNPENLERQRAIMDKARQSPKRLPAVAAALRTPEHRAKTSVRIKKIWAERKKGEEC